MKRLLASALCVPALALALGAASSTQPKKPAATSRAKFVFNLLPRAFQWRPELEIWVVTERTERGASLPEPSPAEPRYYRLVSGGYHALGEAHENQREAKSETLARVLDLKLREQSLLPAPTEQPAGLILTYLWGTHVREQPTLETRVVAGRGRAYGTGGYVSAFPGGGSYGTPPAFFGPGANVGFAQSSDGSWSYGINAGSSFDYSNSGRYGWYNDAGPELETYETPAPMSHVDMCERAALLVGDNFARALQKRFAGMPEDQDRPGESWFLLRHAARQEPRGYFLLQTMDDSLYYVVVSAYDAKSVAEGKRELLWRTKIAVTSNGISQLEAMPALLDAAGRFFGRETDRGQLLARKLDRRGRVIVGEPTVIDWQASEAEDAAARIRNARR